MRQLKLLPFLCSFLSSMHVMHAQVILSVSSQADSGHGSLRAVLDAANAIDLSDEVIVDLSLLQSINFPNPAVVELSSGELTINRPMEWVTQGSPDIFTIRNTNPSSRIVTISNSVDGLVRISGVRFEGGRAFPAPGFAGVDGGAIRYNQTTGTKKVSLHLTRCEFLDNHAGPTNGVDLPGSASGGAISFSGNTFNGEVPVLWMNNCLFESNEVNSSGVARGSAIHAVALELQIENSRFIGNRVPFGGASSGAAVLVASPARASRIQGSLFRGNTAPGTSALEYTANVAPIEESAVLLEVADCLFEGNGLSNSGVACRLQGINYPAKAVFRNTTWTRNTALSTSCVHFLSWTEAAMQHCTVVGNSHSNTSGRAIFLESNASLQVDFAHSIIAANNCVGGTQNASFSPDIRLPTEGTVTTGGYNLIGSGTGLTGVFNHSDDHLGLDNNNRLDPQLAGLGDYGGPVHTMPPLPDSLAVDAIPGPSSGLVPVDVRGIARPQGFQGDIGAVELPRVPYATWKLQIPLAAVQEPNDDPDGDGLKNLFEYFLGSDPNSFTHNPLQLVETEDGWFAEFERSATIRPVLIAEWEVQHSTGLTSWTKWIRNAEVSPAVEGQLERLRYRFPLDEPLVGKEFFRLGVR